MNDPAPKPSAIVSTPESRRKKQQEKKAEANAPPGYNLPRIVAGIVLTLALPVVVVAIFVLGIFN